MGLMPAPSRTISPQFCRVCHRKMKGNNLYQVSCTACHKRREILEKLRRKQ